MVISGRRRPNTAKRLTRAQTMAFSGARSASPISRWCPWCRAAAARSRAPPTPAGRATGPASTLTGGPGAKPCHWPRWHAPEPQSLRAAHAQLQPSPQPEPNSALPCRTGTGTISWHQTVTAGAQSAARARRTIARAFPAQSCSQKVYQLCELGVIII